MIAAMDAMEDKFILPETAKFEMVTRKEFYNHLASLAQSGYDKWGALAKFGLPPPAEPKGPRKGSREELVQHLMRTQTHEGEIKRLGDQV